MQPETRYAKSGGIYIAYQVFGDGPLNVVFAPPAFTNVEHWWDGPDVTRWLLRLASYARVVMFDKRGTGLSDRVTDLPGLDHRIDDLRTVMDAVGMEQAALLGVSEGGDLEKRTFSKSDGASNNSENPHFWQGWIFQRGLSLRYFSVTNTGCLSPSGTTNWISCPKWTVCSWMG